MSPAVYSMLCQAGISVLRARQYAAWADERGQSEQVDWVRAREASDELWVWAARYLLTALLAGER